MTAEDQYRVGWSEQTERGGKKGSISNGAPDNEEVKYCAAVNLLFAFHLVSYFSTVYSGHLDTVVKRLTNLHSHTFLGTREILIVTHEDSRGA